MDGLEGILNKYKGKDGALLSVLQEAQGLFGYLSKDILSRIAKGLGIPLAQVYGVVTFYAQFYLTPHGKYTIRVCRGTACHVRGAPQILEEIKRELRIEEGQTTPDSEYSLETVACIGCCALAPCIMINDEVEGRMTSKKAKELFAKR